MVTNKFQQERLYKTIIVNIGGDEKLKNYEDTQKELVTKVKNIIQKYQQSSSIKTPENQPHL